MDDNGIISADILGVVWHFRGGDSVKISISGIEAHLFHAEIHLKWDPTHFDLLCRYEQFQYLFEPPAAAWRL